MTQEAAEIRRRALALSPEERSDLAATLIDSLDPAEQSAIDAAWQEEISRRIKDLDSGKVQPISQEEFLARLRKATE